MKSSLSITIAGHRGNSLASHARAPRRESAPNRHRRTPLPAGRPFCPLARVLALLAGTVSLVVAEAAAPGQVLWTFEAGGYPSSPAIGADGTVYVGTKNGGVHALDGVSGQRRWQGDPAGSVQSIAVAPGGTVYLGCDRSWSDEYGLRALDAATGRTIWEFSTGGFTDPAIALDGTVYLTVATGLGSMQLSSRAWPAGTSWWRLRRAGAGHAPTASPGIT